jgi:hypothetical protein
MTKEKAQARREHLNKMRAEQKAKERRTAMLMWGVGGLVILLLIGGVGEHVWTAVKYKENPPVGGQHNNYWQQCDIYDKPIHNEHAVHSLEHGAVWITYRPDLPKAQIDKIKSIAGSTGDANYMLVSPYPNLPAPIVASSWGHQLTFQNADDPKLPKFITKYQNGPDTPELGATCGGEYAITATADQQPLPPEPKGEATPLPSESLAPSTSPSPAQS